MMRKFWVKPVIYFSDGAVDALTFTHPQRIFVIIDPVIRELGYGGLIEKAFAKRNDVTFKYFDNVKPDPSIELVTDGAREMLRYRPDMLIAVGGGSTIDEAKAVLYIYNKAIGERCQDFEKPFFAVIPTTSGTGSEVTEATVITTGDKKIIMFDKDFLPDMAILDIEFIKNMPLPLLAESAIDTLSHAVETFVSKYANVFTDAVAEKTVKLAFRYLEEIFEGHDTLEARTTLLHAACMGGIGFTNASLGINHSIAHALGGAFHISHGKANGILLTKTLRFNLQSRAIEEKLVCFCRELGIVPAHASDCSSAFIEKINVLLRLCNMPVSIRETGLSMEEYGLKIPAIAQTALDDPCTAGNPVAPTVEDLIDILVKAY